ncbi:MAG TPA: outer membrane protein assembly factor BamD [Thermoanaerobaculia bacterium]|nr:outer membrane protein assembly factor BamD [Thermoanaerobaculia bacterium]
MTRKAVALALLACAFLGACKSSKRQDPILALAAPESLAKGKDLLSKEKYARARPYLLHAFEVEPNSVTGREALLLAADTFYLEGGSTNFLQAEAKYRDFLNRFPTSDRAAYAQFQVAAALARRMERPDRDQSTARQALEAFQDLQRTYPTSEFAAQARDQIRLVRDNLAEHEFVVGQFYLRYGIDAAAISRLEFLLESYPDYTAKDKIYFHLGRAYGRSGRGEEAESSFGKLTTQYPDSPYIAAIEEAREEIAKASAQREKRARRAGTRQAPAAPETVPSGGTT